MDDQGDLFRQVMSDPPPPPPAEAPSEPAPPAPAGTETQPPAPATPAPPADENIPSWRLREESEARRQAESRAQTLENRLREIEGHIQRAAGERKPTNFFEDPARATQEAVNAVLAPFIANTQQQFHQLGRMVAESAHGGQGVADAEEAFLKAMEARTLDPADYERVVQAPNRYDAVVKWHKRSQTLSLVGSDPMAWFESQLTERLKDPTFTAKIFEAMQNRPPTGGGSVQLPPSLSSMPGAGARAKQDGPLSMADPSLFDYAFRQGR